MIARTELCASQESFPNAKETSLMDFLVVDDDKTFRYAICLLIDAEGHYSESAETGEIGLMRLKEEKFSAVLLDLNLGGVSGLDILVEIHKKRPYLPVVMFTAQGKVATAVEAMRRGAHSYGHPSWAAAAACESWIQALAMEDPEDLPGVESLIAELASRK